jgi:hypothetical protein
VVDLARRRNIKPTLGERLRACSVDQV